MQKTCQHCKKMIVEAKSATKYCSECAKIVLAENRRQTGYKYYALHNHHKCNKCGEPIPPKKHLCKQCKNKRTSMKQLREQLSKLNYQLELYEKMFTAQEDMINDKDAQIQELKNDNARLQNYVDNLQKSSYEYDNVSLYAKRLVTNKKGEI